MAEFLLFSSVVLIICLIMNKITYKLPVPSLIFFLMLGMIFGIDGIFGIAFDDYQLSEIICSVALVFIMYYGGFGTNFKTAKSVIVPSFVLSSLGVLFTALILGAFIHFVFNIGWIESFLMSSVISSTDAASVFNVLRSKNLALKYHTDSMLEVESGSNDPMSYMLTIFFISIIQGENISIISMIFNQIILSVLIGLLLGKIGVYVLNKSILNQGAGCVIFIFALSMFAYGLPSVIGANGYLSVYLCGMLMGNSFISGKKEMVHFFDVLTENAQMVIFFLLGLLVTPSELGQVLVPAIIITVILTFITRPMAVALVLAPFKAKLNQILVVSWAGFRGVASIVFSIYIVLSGISLDVNIFNLVFVIVLLSLVFQGTLLPFVAKKLDMIDENSNILYTFNDYRDDNEIAFVKIKVGKEHEYAGKKLSEIAIPKQMLVILILRDKAILTPDGNTVIECNDILVIGAKEFTDKNQIGVCEVQISHTNRWLGKRLKDIEGDRLIIMIKRNDQLIVPDGNTKLLEDDIVVMTHVSQTGCSFL